MLVRQQRQDQIELARNVRPVFNNSPRLKGPQVEAPLVEALDKALTSSEDSSVKLSWALRKNDSFGGL